MPAEAGFGGTGRTDDAASVTTRSKPAANARRLGSIPMPAARMVASYASRGNGSAPLPAIAPNKTAEMALPVFSARSAMSKATKRFAAVSAASKTLLESLMPSPGTNFSCTANERCDEAISVVLSGVTRPRWMARPASISSAPTTTSTSPGTGISDSTG